MLGKDGGKERLQGGANLFSQEGFMRNHREVTRALTGGTESLNDKREQCPQTRYWV